MVALRSTPLFCATTKSTGVSPASAAVRLAVIQEGSSPRIQSSEALTTTVTVSPAAFTPASVLSMERLTMMPSCTKFCLYTLVLVVNTSWVLRSYFVEEQERPITWSPAGSSPSSSASGRVISTQGSASTFHVQLACTDRVSCHAAELISHGWEILRPKVIAGTTAFWFTGRLPIISSPWDRYTAPERGMRV